MNYQFKPKYVLYLAGLGVAGVAAAYLYQQYSLGDCKTVDEKTLSNSE